MLYEDIFDAAVNVADVGRYMRQLEEAAENVGWGKCKPDIRLEEDTFEFYGGMAMLYLERCLKGERWPRGREIGGGAEGRVRKEVRALDLRRTSHLTVSRSGWLTKQYL